MNRLIYLCILLASQSLFSQKLNELNAYSFKFLSVDSCGQSIQFSSNNEPIVRIKSYKGLKKIIKKYNGYIIIQSPEQNENDSNCCSIKIYYITKMDYEVELIWGDFFKPNNNLGKVSMELDSWFLLGANSKGNYSFKNNLLIFEMKTLNFSNENICISFKLEKF